MAGRQSPRKKNDPVPLSTDACQDDEVEPLSGAFFHVMLLKSHVSSVYQLVVPAKFTHLLPQETVPVILGCGRREWETRYHGNHPTHKRFDSLTWKTFVMENQLKIGDACVFELVGPLTERIIKFKVQILRGDFPSALVERMDGTKDKPMVID